MVQVDGYFWPETDRHARKAIFSQVRDAERALKYCKNFNTVVQAGGNCGVWANYLRDRFDEVYSIEPDWQNYLCLLKNTKDVKTIWAALGCGPGFVGMEVDPSNIGAHQVSGKGRIPVITIDELALTACDLICLDIEGMEPEALKGAKETIARFKPILMVEDKGLSDRYGFRSGWSEHFEGYDVAERIHRDVILRPKS